MIRLYALLLVLGVLGGAGYGAYAYYKDSQQRIATLTENNAKLETAIQTSEASIATLQQEAEANARLTKQLQTKLQTAEQYGDNLRKRLRQLDLVGDAIKDAENLEGRMNGATAKLWRDMERDTGGTGDNPLPKWLQLGSGEGDPSSNADAKSDGSDSSETKTD